MSSDLFDLFRMVVAVAKAPGSCVRLIDRILCTRAQGCTGLQGSVNPGP